jgi:hypothetical protein
MDSNSQMLSFVQGQLPDGTPYWVYAVVKPSKYAEFMECTKAGKPIAFKQYGTVLKSGQGTQVPDSVKQEMKEKFGFDDDYEARLLTEVREAQAIFGEQQEAARIAEIVEMLKRKQAR